MPCDAVVSSTELPITELVNEWNLGSPEALNQLVTLLYAELKRLAAQQVRRGGPNTLEPTALVHEAYLRLAVQAGISVEGRAHFFHLVAHVMRCVLVDRARARITGKRGGQMQAVPLDSRQISAPIPDRDLIALDDALRSLETVDRQKSRLVELRFFAGMSVEEAAEVLHISPRKAAREWIVAKARLYAEISAITAA